MCTLLAVGSLTSSEAGDWSDLSGLTYSLENGVPANSLGGFGSGIAYASGNYFLAVPDRGPNAASYDSNVDDTVSYVNRFHTIKANLEPNTTGVGLPYTLETELHSTTLLWSPTALNYGTGAGLDLNSGATLGSGVPPINTATQFYFTGRSDNFDGTQNSGNAADARLDTESIRLSNDGQSVFISDEYGPYIYQFDRNTGARTNTFQLPASFFVTSLSPKGATEIANNTSGRVANKGMEGMAITPDGTTLVGMMQQALIQDATAGATKLLRIVTIDIGTGNVTHQYAYLLTAGTGISEIIAINNNEFLVDERDGKGRGDGSSAKVKQLFKINLNGATDVSEMDGPTAATHAIAKTLVVDLVKLFNANGIASTNIPAKIEGLAFGADIKQGRTVTHTLWIANDNDFLQTVGALANPNQFFVIGFTDSVLGGSTTLLPQQFTFKAFVP